MKNYQIDVDEDVNKTRLLYNGPVEDLEKFRENFPDVQSSDIYPSYETAYERAIFFHRISSEFLDRLNAQAKRHLAGSVRDLAQKGDSAKTSISPAWVVLVLLLLGGGGWAYNEYLWEDPIRWDKQTERLREAVLGQGSSEEAPDLEDSSLVDSSRQDETQTGSRAVKPPEDQTSSDTKQFDTGVQTPANETPQTGAAEPRGPPATSSIDPLVGKLEISFIDVGQGDATLIKTPDDHVVVYDAGERGQGDKVLEEMDRLGVNRIDHLVLSHPHADHIGGAATLLQEVEVEQVWDAGVNHTTQTYKQILRLIDQKGVDYSQPKSGESFDWGNYCRAEVKHPAEGKSYHDLNNASIVVVMTCDELRVFFAGDAEESAERAMLERHHFQPVDFLQAGHHGSKTSSTRPFLREIRPSRAVLSAGADNSYGHPSPVTLSKMENLGIKIYRTDRDGTIRVQYSGSKVRVETEK